MTADSEGALARRLQEQGLSVSSINQVKGKKAAANAAGGAAKRPNFGKIKETDLAVFCRQFSTMMDAGVPLVRCLTVLQEQAGNPKLSKTLNDVRSQVESGETLSRALSRHPGAFSTLFVGLVRAGEASGALEESLQRLAGFMEKNMELKRKIKSAMTYPTIVAVVAVIIVLGLVGFVLPKFLQLFKDLGQKEEDFPAMTRVLMNFSHFLTDGFPMRQVMVIAGLAIFITGWRKFSRTKVGKRVIDTARLKMPVFGKLNHKLALARFSRTLSTLLQSGVPILGALETVAGTVDNDIIGDSILEARSRIREGDRIATPLQTSRMFPPMIVQMVTIGEESGALDSMLGKVAEFYEGEVDAAVESLTASIEPLMIVGMGLTVGFIVIAMFMPLVAVIQSMTQGTGS
jgi:type IV pilus assembly protein PilC